MQNKREGKVEFVVYQELFDTLIKQEGLNYVYSFSLQCMKDNKMEVKYLLELIRSYDPFDNINMDYSGCDDKEILFKLWGSRLTEDCNIMQIIEFIDEKYKPAIFKEQMNSLINKYGLDVVYNASRKLDVITMFDLTTLCTNYGELGTFYVHDKNYYKTAGREVNCEIKYRCSENVLLKLWNFNTGNKILNAKEKEYLEAKKRNSNDDRLMTYEVHKEDDIDINGEIGICDEYYEAIIKCEKEKEDREGDGFWI